MKQSEFNQRFMRIASKHFDQSSADNVAETIYKALDGSKSTDEKITKVAVEAYRLSNDRMLKILAAELSEFLVDED